MHITVDEKKKEEQTKRERRNDETRKGDVDKEKATKSRGNEKESVVGTSSKRNIHEILKQAEGDSTHRTSEQTKST